VRGQARTFTFNASDPSPVDQAASFSYAIAWGDGSTQTVSGPANLSVDHVFTTTGTYTVSVTATDKDGGASGPAQQAITIKTIDLQGGTLAVGGTTGDDNIVIKPNDTQGNVLVTIGGANQGVFLPTTQILVFGQAGNDKIQFSTKSIQGTTYYITVNAILFGDAGNDTLDARGSTANNVLVGGAGTDTLQGGAGRDILLGGAGADTLHGNGGDDVIIGNITDYDSNLAALNALMAEWARTDADYNTRVNHLLGNTTGGNNGNVVLNLQTVHDDAAIDQLYGEAGLDLFFYTAAGANKDKLNDPVQGEVTVAM
jgi:Ca2+-binding RTX toxin-like protein